MIVRIEDPSIFVGLTYPEALTRITDRGYEPVLASNSTGEGRLLVRHTKPVHGYDPLRVQLEVHDTIVTKAKIG